MHRRFLVHRGRAVVLALAFHALLGLSGRRQDSLEVRAGCLLEDLLLVQYCVAELFKKEVVIHDLPNAVAQNWKLQQLVYAGTNVGVHL